MRIAHVITKGDVGGAQSHVLHLAVEQHARGHEVVVLAGSSGLVTDELVARGIEVVVEPSLRRSIHPARDLLAASTLKDRLAERAPDIVHAHSSKAGLLARLAARRLRVPAVYTAHGWPFQPGAPLGQRLVSRAGETLAGRLWGHVICLTEAELHLARRGRVVPSRRLHLVPLGLPDVPASAGRATLDGCAERLGPVRLVMVARFAPPKDQAGLVGALASLRDLNWRLSFVGDGPERAACVALVGATQLSDRVEFLGERADVAEILAASDVAVVWSRYEGMPLALLEAMRAGVAVVCSDLPGARAVVGESGCALLATEAPTLATHLAALIRDPELRARLGRAGRDRFVAEHSVEKMCDLVDSVYRAALSDSSRAGSRE